MANYSVDFTDCPSLPTNKYNNAYMSSVTSDSNGELGSSSYYTYEDGSKKGLIQSTYESYYDKSTKQWKTTSGSTVSDYITYIKNTPGTINFFTMLTNPAGSEDVQRANLINAIADQQANHDKLKEHVEAEYCHYRSRYNKFLQAFFDSVRTTDPVIQGKSSAYLGILIEYNARLNALAGLVNYFMNLQIGNVDLKKNAVNAMNAELNTAIAELNAGQSFLADDAVINTRKEMIRYTKEKNNAIANQISLWASLNVVAIALIFHLYRTM